MSLCILHGYLLEGSGSNLWTRSVIQSLCRNGETVHLMCQENHPDRYDFIAEAYLYQPDGTVETLLRRDTPYPGRCIMHKPKLGATLPVYVWDKYEEFSHPVPMVDLDDEVINEYLDRNTRVLGRIVREREVSAMHANHAVLMSVVAQRVGGELGVPYAIMPHGSAIEYAVKKDDRFMRYAQSAFTDARRIFVIGQEMRQRVLGLFADTIPGLGEKLTELNLGADTSLFTPIAREQRPATIEGMLEALRDVPRGRSAEQTEAFRSRLRGEMGLDELRAAIKEAGQFASKSPDADLEAKLGTVNWASDPTLLFVGRQIAGKGIQSVLAAMPLILEAHPDARLVVVGHGPMREVLEALLWAWEHDERRLAELIVANGRALEGQTEESATDELVEVRALLEQLTERGEAERFWEAARSHIRPDRVIYTGYLTHRELRYLFPCADVAVFPSVVKEAGPLVFLEALAAGCFPLGTYFGGMAASIDAVGQAVSPEAAEAMKLSPEPEQTAADIVRQADRVLRVGDQYKVALRRLAEERYDWRSVGRKLSTALHGVEQG